MPNKVKIIIDLEKSIENNASGYFQKGKEALAKKEKVEIAITDSKRKLKKLEKSKPIIEEKEPEKKKAKKWYEKFHWFYTSNKFLAIAGRDKHSNEMLVKKHMQEKDLYFHTDIQGAAHVILKEGQSATKDDKKEAATFAAVFSKAWQYGYGTIDVYSVNPKQVTKQAPSGESISSGAFMIYGKREWYKSTALEFAIGVKTQDEFKVVISGPSSAIKKHSEYSISLAQGKKSKSDLAKDIKKGFLNFYKNNAQISLDEIIRMLPGDGLIQNSNV